MKSNEKVRKYLDDKHMTQREMARRIGVTDSTFGKFLAGSQLLRAPYFCRLAKEMRISVEELIGEDDPPQKKQVSPPQRKNDKNTLGNKINENMLSLGLTQVQLAKKTGVVDTTISRWINGDVPKSLILIYRLSKIFGCTIDDLVSGCVEFMQ